VKKKSPTCHSVAYMSPCDWEHFNYIKTSKVAADQHCTVRAAIQCPRQQTVGPAVRPADIPQPC